MDFPPRLKPPLKRGIVCIFPEYVVIYSRVLRTLLFCIHANNQSINQEEPRESSRENQDRRSSEGF